MTEVYEIALDKFEGAVDGDVGETTVGSNLLCRSNPLLWFVPHAFPTVPSYTKWRKALTIMIRSISYRIEILFVNMSKIQLLIQTQEILSRYLFLVFGSKVEIFHITSITNTDELSFLYLLTYKCPLTCVLLILLKT